MKNWLIHRLGGVPKQTYMVAAESYEGTLAAYVQRLSKLKQENAAMKAEKAEMEEAGKEMSERISELIDKLNEERKVSNGLMAKGTALGIKVSELQDELERKDKELSDTKVQLLDVLRNKPDSALRSEIARLKGELELLNRNKFKRGRK
nr:MAG TPA: cell division protein [Caudoviricetes sp.]